MTGELGQLALCFALALSLVMAVSRASAGRAERRAASAQAIASGAANGLLVFIALAFGALTYAFVDLGFFASERRATIRTRLSR